MSLSYFSNIFFSSRSGNLTINFFEKRYKICFGLTISLSNVSQFIPVQFCAITLLQQFLLMFFFKFSQILFEFQHFYLMFSFTTFSHFIRKYQFFPKFLYKIPNIYTAVIPFKILLFNKITNVLGHIL